MRYKGIKGKFWALLSHAIRDRDYSKYKRCISCAKRIVKDDKCKINGHAGHYAPAGNCGFGLRFDPKNIHLECAGCNLFDNGHLIRYRYGLIERYGDNFVNTLDKRYKDMRSGKIITKEWTKKIFEEEYKKLKNDPQKYVKII